MSEIRNLHPDPRCLRVRSVWHGTWVMSGEKRRYSLADDGAPHGSCFAWEPLTNAQMAGHVLYARISDADETVLNGLGIESAPTIVKRDGWIAARVGDNVVSNHTLSLETGAFTLCEIGVYTPDDWESLYALYQKGAITYPWVAGPRNATAAGEKGPWEL